MNNKVLINRLRKEFPLWDLRGANEVEHHCELAMFHDRKRLHALLDSLQSPAPEGVEPTVVAIAEGEGLDWRGLRWSGRVNPMDIPANSPLMTIAQHRAIVAGLGNRVDAPYLMRALGAWWQCSEDQVKAAKDRGYTVVKVLELPAAELGQKAVSNARMPSLMLVRQLREATGEGLVHCRKALEACDWDVAEAKEWLRRDGMI